MWAWEPQEFSEMEGPLAVQEYIQQMIRMDSSEVDTIITIPKGCDKNVWVCEHIRQLVLELNLFVTQLKSYCTPNICPLMRVNSESYRCVVKNELKECSAIEYMIHNLNHAISALQNEKTYSSRLSVSDSTLKSFEPIMRRLYRIFAHAWVYHREFFEEFENEMHLCERFTLFCKKYQIMPESSFLIKFNKK